MRLILQRIQENHKQTIGDIFYGSFQFNSLELGWHNNEQNISRIPAGIYDVVKRYSTSFNDHFHVLNVPGRGYILIHTGNYNYDTRGCILVGSSLKDINGDGLVDVIDSLNTMNALNNILPNKFELEIKDINYIGDLDPKTEKKV